MAWIRACGGNGSDIELTQEEYDALPDSKYTNNINYFIRNGRVPNISNLNIDYELLYSSVEFSDTINFTESLSSFDAVIVVAADIKSDSKWYSTNIYMTESIIASDSIIGANNETYSIWYTVNSDTQWIFKNRTTNTYVITSVYGLRFSSGITEERVNELIDAKLEVIENGTY